MGEWMLCHEKKAVKPYFLSTIGHTIYTLEELCYYCWQYTHLLEEEPIDEKLELWIRGQLGMEQLADSIHECIQSGESMKEAAELLFEQVPYLSEQELRRYRQNLQALRQMTPYEKRKQSADRLVWNKKYNRALYEYQMLLRQEEQQSEEMRCSIYHNMGVAYAKMFYFKQACESFLKAFLLSPNKESLKQYKAAMQLCEEEQQEDELIKEFPGSASVDMSVYEEIQKAAETHSRKDKEIEAVRQLKNDGKVAEYYQMLEEILHKWQEECREYMSSR